MRRLKGFWSVSVGVLMLAACAGDSPSSKATTPATGKAVTDARGIEQREPSFAPGKVSVGRGAPHSANIDKIAMSSDGSAALTRDVLGGVRLWPNLTGDQPIPVPLRGARELSLASSAAGWTVAAIDSAGAARVMRLGANGFTQLMATKPHATAIQIELLPGGEHAIILGSDHRIQLVKTDGTVLATEEQRQFRPTRVELARNGKSMRAVLVETTGKTTEVSLPRVSIDIKNKPHLRRAGTSKPFLGAAALGHPHAALSPSGNRFAYLKFAPAVRSAAAVKVAAGIVVVEIDSGKTRTLEAQLRLPQNASIGFVGEDKLLASAAPLGRTWLVDLTTDRLFPRAGPPTHFARQRMAHGYGANRRVVGVGRWLYVQNAKVGSYKYLGFSNFEPMSAATSPDGKHTVWLSSRGHSYVEPVAGTGGGGKVVHLATSMITPAFRAFFADNDHIIFGNTVGGLRLVRWADGKQISAADAGGPFQSIELSPDRSLLRVGRTNGEAWVYEVSAASGFSGPYIVGDGGISSGLLGTNGSADPVLWTIDAKNIWRTYTLAELRSGLSHKAMKGKGTSLATAGGIRPLAVDADGARYLFRRVGTGATIEIWLGTKKERTLRIPISTISRVVPSPTGRHIAVVMTTGVVVVYDRASGNKLWSYSFLTAVNDLAWSPDATQLVGVSHLGGAMLEAATGKVKHKTCGPWFEVRSSAPANIFSSTRQPNLCEP